LHFILNELIYRYKINRVIIFKLIATFGNAATPCNKHKNDSLNRTPVIEGTSLLNKSTTLINC